MTQSEQVLAVLRQSKQYLFEHFGVVDLAVFGSTVRNTRRDDSDVDVWVTFNDVANAKRYFGVQFYLEDALQLPVDLVTDKAMRSELRPFIEREAVHV